MPVAESHLKQIRGDRAIVEDLPMIRGENDARLALQADFLQSMPEAPQRRIGRGDPLVVPTLEDFGIDGRRRSPRRLHAIVVVVNLEGVEEQEEPLPPIALKKRQGPLNTAGNVLFV